MKLLSTIRADWEKELFRQNGDSVVYRNMQVLKVVIPLTLFISLVLLAISFVSPVTAEYREYYCIYSILNVLIAICCKFIGFEKMHLIGLYLELFAVALLGYFLSFSGSPDGLGLTFLGVMILLPLCPLDRSLRIELFSLFVLGLYALLAFNIKNHEAAVLDIITDMSFWLGSIMVARRFRWVAMEVAELRRKANIRERTDFLTTLGNRFSLFEELSKSEQKVAAPVNGIMMLDIDYFKQFNDTYGHQAGDDCLRSIGKLFRELGEKHGVKFFRFGGEEFICVSLLPLPGFFEKIANEIAENLVALKIPHAHSATGFVTMSIGYKEYFSNETHYASMISDADKALYVAKKAGRNRAVDFATVENPDEIVLESRVRGARN